MGGGTFNNWLGRGWKDITSGNWDSYLNHAIGMSSGVPILSEYTMWKQLEASGKGWEAADKEETEKENKRRAADIEAAEKAKAELEETNRIMREYYKKMQELGDESNRMQAEYYGEQIGALQDARTRYAQAQAESDKNQADYLAKSRRRQGLLAGGRKGTILTTGKGTGATKKTQLGQ